MNVSIKIATKIAASSKLHSSQRFRAKITAARHPLAALLLSAVVAQAVA